jgi:serine/threonine protein kinase
MTDRMISQTSRSHGGATHPTQVDSKISLSHRRGALSGECLGDYQLGQLLGAGGMAEVYQAEDLVLQREVAVKVLTTPVADDTGKADRFRTEAQRLASLSHPHLVPVYDFAEAEIQGQRLLFLVMPLLHESLRDLRRREGKLPAAAACQLMLQVANGLEAVHQSGIIHRDVKPGNILLDMDGHPLLADFGIACELGAASPGKTGGQNDLVVGTPDYMAPEQLCGDSIDQRVDVYALGAVFYELLTGQPPFVGATAHDVAIHALYAPLIPPSVLASDVDPDVEHVVLTALARDCAERYATASGFALALRNTAMARHAKSQRLELSPRLPRIAPLVGWDNDDTVPAQLLPVSGSKSWLDGFWRWHRLWPLVLAAALLLLIFGAGHILASSPYGTEPRIGSVPTIRAPATGEAPPPVTKRPTSAPPSQGLVIANQVTTNAKSQPRHHHSKPQGKHHDDGQEADHHDDDYVSQLHGVVRKAQHHSGRLQEVILRGDGSNYDSGWSGRASGLPHPPAKNM